MICVPAPPLEGDAVAQAGETDTVQEVLAVRV
jgi:hypothetical protein